MRRLEDICLDILHPEDTLCIQKVNDLTLLIQKADAMACIVQTLFALTLVVRKANAQPTSV